MEFLDGPATEKKIKNILASAKKIRVAVAYWGAGAIDRLNLGRLQGRDIRVICDLMSGACNPKEIKKLQNIIGTEKVKMLDRLHAKVWLTESAAIVGSSNASSNGLDDEGDSARASFEANVLITDPKIREAISHWFDGLDSRPIDDKAMKLATQRWKTRQANRPILDHGTLLDIARKNPAAFRGADLAVWLYEGENYTAEATSTLNRQRKYRYNNKLCMWEGVEKKHVKAGSYVIDFSFDREGRVDFHGFFKIVSDKPYIEFDGGNIVLCTEEKSFKGKKIGNRSAWLEAAKRANKKANGREMAWPAEKFFKEYL